MDEESIFGLPLESSSPDESEEITDEAVTEEVDSEGSPSDDGPARDEQGRFVAADAPEEEPEPALETEEPEQGDEQAIEEADQELDAGETQPLEEVQEEKPYLWANKYETPEELEKGHGEAIRMWQRANEARKAEAQRALQLEEQYAALYTQMQQAIPVLQVAAQREEAYRTFAEKYKEQYGAYPEGYSPPAPRPAPGPADVNAMVDQRLAQERAAWQAQQAEQQDLQSRSTAVSGFYANHPDLQPEYGQEYGPADHAIADTYEQLNMAWDRYGIEIDPTDQGTIEVLYQASQDAALLEVLKMRPEYFESAYGMELARRDAAVISGRAPATTGPVTEQKPKSQLRSAGGRKPYTESAAVGAAAPAGEDENDPWVRIKNAPSAGGARSGESSIFFE